MHYQSSEGDSPKAVWNRVIDTLVCWSPELFGCRRAALEEVSTKREFENLVTAIQKMDGVKVAEAQASGGHRAQFYFRVQKKPVVLIVAEGKPVQIIAPSDLIEHLEKELKIVL